MAPQTPRPEPPPPEIFGYEPTRFDGCFNAVLLFITLAAGAFILWAAWMSLAGVR